MAPVYDNRCCNRFDKRRRRSKDFKLFRVMKALNYTPNHPPGRRFDNPAISLIVHWMHPLRLKAFRGFAASAALFVATAGCETDGETVPVRTAGIPSAAATPRPVQLAYAEPAKTETATASTS